MRHLRHQALSKAQAAEALQKKVDAAENALALQTRAFEALQNQLKRLEDELQRSAESFNEQMASAVSHNRRSKVHRCVF